VFHTINEYCSNKLCECADRVNNNDSDEHTVGNIDCDNDGDFADDSNVHYH
jgi:hypothetical protein